MEIAKETTRPALLEVKDYRSFLRAVFDGKKSLNPRFSFRRFSLLAGFKSPNYLQMILEGRRNLSLETAADLAQRLKLSAHERSFFLALIKLDCAKTESETHQAERERLVAISKILAKDIPASQREIFSRWHHLLVRELFFLRDVEATPKWISKRLAGCISESEAGRSLELLVECGFLQFRGGRYVPVDPVLSSDETVLQAASMRKFHRETLRVWAHYLDDLPADRQELGVLNIPISREKIPELRKRILQFQNEIIGWVQDEKEADCVVQLGTYLIGYPGEEG